MNNKEYWSQVNARRTSNYRMIHAKLKEWKLENNITERCVVHHRDDTDETRKYNEEHYERWGFNEDDTFEYGKYVVFMTLTDHSVYHNIGKKLSEEHCAKISAANKGKENPMYGKHHSIETCTKISAANKGKMCSEETRAKMSAAHKGKMCSGETCAKISAACKGKKVLYATYKNNGGTLKWNDFQKALKSGDITFETQPITVYTSK